MKKKIIKNPRKEAITPEPDIIAKIEEKPEEKKKYTRGELNSLSFEKLLDIAKKLDIPVSKEALINEILRLQ